MKRLLFTALIGFWLLDAVGQTTFNLRDRYDFLACTLTSIVPTDSCYYFTGIIADTVFPYRTGSIFLKTDLIGTPVVIKTLRNPVKSYETWYNSLHSMTDGGFTVVGQTEDTAKKSLLIRYGANGDTIFTKEYPNPFFPEGQFIAPWGGSVVLPDGGLVFLNWIEKSSTIKAEYYLVRTDSLGNMVWGKVFGTPKWERPESILLTPDGKVLCGGVRTNQSTNVQGLTFQCHIFQFDTLGNYEWEYTSPLSAGLRDAANDLLLLDDGSIVVASGVGHEQQNSSVNEVYFDRYLFKLNPQHEIEWEVTFPDSALTSWARTTNLVELSDGSGFIVAGTTYNSQPPPKYFTIRGWLAKVSPEGDSIWTRRYAFLTDGENEHNIYDMKETPDGGVVLCGNIRDWSTGATYPQQAWLLKLDGHGCLVPGCHLSDGAGEAAGPQARLAVYPNPTSDYLNFFLSGPAPAGSNASFRIVDANGRTVRAFGGSTWGTTFVVPVHDWPTGTYWLQYLVDGAVRAVEAVAVVR